MKRIGIVVQRYGDEVVGGSERLARNVAERLNAGGYDITVFTTTARDYITWNNHYPAGESILRGVKLRRFPVTGSRDIERFNSMSESFFAREAGDRNEMDWIARQGPETPALVDALTEENRRFDLIIFFTYLYYPTVKGITGIETRIALFPTAHDEPPIHLNIMKPVFTRPDILFFLTAAEMDLVKRLFDPPGRMVLIRTGVDAGQPVVDESFRGRYRLFLPYLLYAGRIERGKGLEEVFSAFENIRARRPMDLVLIGNLLMPLPEIDGIRYLGFIPEEDKAPAFRNALASLQPSRLESLSITTLESFAQETPALVNHHCDVLREHIEASGGGETFASGDELVELAVKMFDHPRTAKRMGEQGYRYIQRYFSWEKVIERITVEVEKLTD